MSFNRKDKILQLLFISGPYAGKSVTLLPDKPLTIGRDREVELPLDDVSLSRRHCVVNCVDGQFYIEDLNSINGTFVNGKRLTTKVELQEFDKLSFGNTKMEFREADFL